MSQLNVDDIYDKAGAFKKQQVVQVVNTTDNAYSTTTSVIPWDNTIPQNTEGAEVITASITPKDSSNLLKIEVNFPCISTSITNIFSAALFKDSDAGAIQVGVSSENSGNYPQNLHMQYNQVAGTTSTTTFKVRVGVDSGTGYLNGNTSARTFGGAAHYSITITEYQPS